MKEKGGEKQTRGEGMGYLKREKHEKEGMKRGYFIEKCKLEER
jgi:hypothetical protein